MAEPQVDFYVLPGSDGGARLRFACRLAEKAWQLRHRVRVQLDPADAATFDQLLWTFSDRSFVPHRRAGAEDDAPRSAPPEVVIAEDDVADRADGDVLICLASSDSPHPGSWARVAEIVDADATRRAAGRGRFRAWRGRGVVPATHEMRNEA